MNLQSLKEVKKNFRILKKWKIKLIKAGEYAGQITVNEKTKRADLWDWPHESERPNDFYFHECLHAAFKELKTLRGAKRYNAEEDLIQDICYIIRLYNWNSKCETSNFYQSRYRSK